MAGGSLARGMQNNGRKRTTVLWRENANGNERKNVEAVARPGGTRLVSLVSVR